MYRTEKNLNKQVIPSLKVLYNKILCLKVPDVIESKILLDEILFFWKILYC